MLLLLTTSGFSVESSHIRRSVYKVNVVTQSPSFSHPWIQGPQSGGSGTGFYIGDGRILTNAHVVANGRYITIQRDGDDHPVVARVKHIANDCDLAILETDTADFFKDAVPLQFGGLPKLRKPVATIGYPKGGEQISITEGVVSRIGYRSYTHSGYHKHILVQVDSAINAGNSGGPVVQGEMVVGVAFQAYTDAENTGYIIPTPVVMRFLKDIEDGHYDEHPDIGLVVLKNGLNNPALRKFHRLEEKDGGVKVTHVASYASTFNLIQKNDILLKIDQQPIGFDGKVIFQGERLDFEVIFDLRQMGDKVSFTLSRQGKIINVVVPVAPTKRHHFMANIYPKFPRFDIYAGLVFTSLSRDYLKVWGSNWFRSAPVHLKFMHWFSQTIPRFKEAKELIVLSGRLPDPVNIDADIFEEAIIDRINGEQIQKLEDVQGAIALGDPDYIVIDLWNQEVPIVLPRAAAQKAHADILKRYNVYPERWLTSIAVFADEGAPIK